MIFEQGTPYFHFALSTTIMYVVLQPQAYVVPLYKMDTCEHEVWQENAYMCQEKPALSFGWLWPQSRVHILADGVQSAFAPLFPSLARYSCTVHDFSAGLDSHIIQE